MEIHAPEQPIHTWRDVALHLGIVTIGILIALGLESLVESRHHQALAREARENIESEIRDNRGEVASFLKYVPDSRKEIDTALQFTGKLLARQPIHGSLNLTLHRSDLSETSWTTAQAIGALSYMGYAEVKKYGAIYTLQSELNSEQTRSFHDLSGVLASMSANFDRAKASEAELRVQQDRLSSLSSGLLIGSQVAAQLLKRYDAVLTGK